MPVTSRGLSVYQPTDERARMRAADSQQKGRNDDIRGRRYRGAEKRRHRSMTSGKVL